MYGCLLFRIFVIPKNNTLTHSTMKLQGRMITRSIHAAAVFFIMIATGIYGCTVQAQSLRPDQFEFKSSHPIAQVKNTPKAIHHVEGINMFAQAIPLNHDINSAYEELKPRLTPGGNRMYFTRMAHPDNSGGKSDLEDIWYTDFDQETGMWSQPARMTGVLNNAGPNYVNNVSVTGDTIILGNQYLKKGKMRAGLSYSVNVNGQWSDPTAIDIYDDYNMSEHANSFVSLKTGVIIRSVQRAETVGQRDLYVSFWDGEKATEPLNMGSVINTAFEESSPYLALDNKTMYFASQGHNGYGGYDIYVTRRLDDSWTNWTQPENLGPAVNGPKDDEFFSLTNCGSYAIFSKQISVHNVDLYRISTSDLFGKPTSAKVSPKRPITQDILAEGALAEL